jgi:hypothetical protein
MKGARVFFVLLALSCALLLGAWAYANCRIPALQFECDLAKIDRVMREEGIAEALAYVNDSVMPRAGYAATHIYLHTVGEYAYASTGSLEEALAYLAPYEGYVERSKFLFGFDGFVHGVLSSYIFAAKDESEFAELIEHVCGGGIAFPGIVGEPFPCHHAIGHALVHANGNALAPALAVCAAVEAGAARDGCRYGAFMEAMSLYFPGYHTGAPRPDVVAPSLRVVCDRFSPEEALSCGYFIGQSYLVSHLGDFDGAFAECVAAPVLMENCALRLGQLSVTQVVHTHEAAEAFCLKHAGSAADACREGAKQGIDAGLAKTWR